LDETEESFASFQGKLAVVWKHKNKEAKASLDKSIQEKIDAEKIIDIFLKDMLINERRYPR
jgi:hypothetical protein